ncbi:IS630 family transposase [Paramaledivibacter caminithermalis]|uniref:Transposase n=1 Tax=Paramaledivibacter caminithermalis (strain DSM 15212 / CIP 107654 / DViRD3) TaxID=1121301 RepID=A0A1M6S8N6_PARC5|nr:IS630 family transposase [Paramaledivibacter caminithermalis]SHK41174.1 Transposase [Paramaledivibacter caminithermalis DSM 15212]
MLETIDTLESSTDTVVYALDETSIRTESNNRASWSEVGAAPILEKNGSHKGINIVGSTCIFNNHHTVNDIYPSDKSITSEEIKTHMEYLLEINPDKEVVVFLDNARTHTSMAMQEFYIKKKSKLKLIFLPKYSPDMNPQENVWNYLKAKLFRPASRSSVYELISDVKDIIDELNSNIDRIRSLAHGRSFLV